MVYGQMLRLRCASLSMTRRGAVWEHAGLRANQDGLVSCTGGGRDKKSGAGLCEHSPTNAKGTLSQGVYENILPHTALAA